MIPIEPGGSDVATGPPSTFRLTEDSPFAAELLWATFAAGIRSGVKLCSAEYAPPGLVLTFSGPIEQALIVSLLNMIIESKPI